MLLAGGDFLQSLRMNAFHKFLIACCCLLMSGCNVLDPTTSYNCQMKGEIFRYRNGVKEPIDGEQSIALKIGIHEWRAHIEVSNNLLVPELNNPEIRLNKKNTNAAERYYQFEKINATSNQKISSNIVINTVSGDTRMFYRRWTMPSDWTNSDQYTFLGNCKKITGAY